MSFVCLHLLTIATLLCAVLQPQLLSLFGFIGRHE
jgi:hypothetical protein